MAVGKTGKCNGCGTVVTIPAVTTVEAEKAIRSPASKDNPTQSVSSAAPRQTGQTYGARPSIDEVGSALSSGMPDLSAAIEEAESIAKAHSAQKLASQLTIAELEAVFKERLPRRPVAVTYRLQLLFVACAMAILPVAYLVLVAAFGLGLYYYVTVGIPNLMSHVPHGRAAIFYVVAVVAPAIAGFVTLLFLIKPLFFRIASESRRRSLTRKGEPLLFEFVDKVCDAVGAPRPKRIDVDYQVNASASPAAGLFSVAKGDMVLTIGVPLLASLSMQHLAGVLAHEFGHFSQRIGMGATLIIRKVNWWFTRVVYQRDALDAMLENAIRESDIRIGLVLQLAQVFVFASRGVLWCFMVVSNAISCGLLRQMEFDADRYEYGLVGSKAFAKTSRELRILGHVQNEAITQLVGLYQRGQLADDMILLGEWIRQSLPVSELKRIDLLVQDNTASLLATHPTDTARIAKSDKADCQGLIALSRPARDLVKHYKPLCKNVTWDFYSDQFGQRISPSALSPTEALVSVHTTRG